MMCNCNCPNEYHAGVCIPGENGVPEGGMCEESKKRGEQMTDKELTEQEMRQLIYGINGEIRLELGVAKATVVENTRLKHLLKIEREHDRLGSKTND